MRSARSSIKLPEPVRHLQGLLFDDKGIQFYIRRLFHAGGPDVQEASSSVLVECITPILMPDLVMLDL